MTLLLFHKTFSTEPYSTVSVKFDIDYFIKAFKKWYQYFQTECEWCAMKK